jgi:hypothetical protein
VRGKHLSIFRSPLFPGESADVTWVRFAGFVVTCLALVSASTAATLSNPRRVGAGFEFSILGASNAIYAIEASRDLQSWTAVATNRQLGETRMISIPSSAQEEFYRARLLRPLFTAAMSARESISFKGAGVRVDSFDSGDPLASTDGQYDPAKARDHGDIITSSALTNSLDLGNAKVRGVLRMPPGGSPIFGPSASVGSSAWVNSGQFGIEPGHLVEETNRVFPDAELPQGNVYVTPGPGLFGTNYYSYVLSNGHYTLPALMVGSTRAMLVTGRAALYVSGSVYVRGGIVITRDASLHLYVGAADASIGFSGVVNESRNAAAFAYYGLPSNVNVSVTGSDFFTGTIYAPAANVFFGGGGNDELDFIGAVVARNITVTGKMGMHYEEHLGVAGPAW